MSEFDNVMKRAAEKLNFAHDTLCGKDMSVRDEVGFSRTANRIMKAQENFYDLGSSTKFSLNSAILNGVKNNFSMNKHNFSASELNSLYDVDVADISIAATVASHGLTYVAMERAMSAVRQNVSFQGLKAVNSAAGYTAGDKVVDPRKAIDAIVDLGRSSGKKLLKAGAKAAGSDLALSLSPAAPVIEGETKAYVTDLATGAKTLVGFATGKVENGKQTIAILNTDFLAKAEVTIATGAISGKTGTEALVDDTATTGYALNFEVCIDRIAEKDGDNTLKLRPYMDSVELVATENRVILQTSLEVQAQMNKILRENSRYGINVDFGKRAIDQVVMLYTYFIDLNVIRSLWEGAKEKQVEAVLDLSGYASANYTSFAATKNDRISKFVRELTSKFLSKTGSPVTALIVDDTAALMLATDAENFKEDPAFRQRRDGLVGYYNNIPVVRNVYLNAKGTYSADAQDDPSTHGVVIGVHKSLNGEAAPVAFGDYLPPYSTLPAINPNNPGELSQALFSQTATKCVVPEFIIRGEIVPFI